MKKPRLLLAVCCGPCATVALERLNPDYEVTSLFYGDNLDTQEEFDRRLDALKKVTDKIIVKPYDHCKWESQNCERCFTLRLKNALEVLEKEGFDFFATCLTTSPHKPAELINKIGKSLSDKYIATDFKKQNGFARSVELSKQLGIYRQKYCGCVNTYYGV